MTRRHSPSRFRLLTAVLVASSASAYALPPAQQSYFNTLTPDQRTAVGAELSACPSCTLEALPDGSPNVIVPSQPANLGVPDTQFPTFWFVPAQPACADQGITLSRDASYEKLLGNSLGGVAYRTRATSTTNPVYGALPVPGRRYTAHAEQAVSGKLLGFSFDVVRADTDAVADTAGARTLTSKLLARSTATGLLQTVDTKTNTAGGVVTLPAISTSRTFWNGSAGFSVGPFPVTVAAALKGSAGHAANGRTSSSEAYVSGTPNASLYVTATAALNVVVAAIGADAQLTLLSGSLPATARMTKSATGYSWTMSSNANLNTLSGYVKAWVRVGYSIFSKTWRHTITSWPGYSWVLSLFNQSGSLPICGAVLAP